MDENDIDSWEQSPTEPAKAYSAFCAYRDMGLARSLAKTAQALNHPPGYKQTLWEWSTKYAWQSRCRDYDQHMERVAQLEKENAIREMINRHARDAVKIQQMVMESLETTSLEATPRETSSACGSRQCERNGRAEGYPQSLRKTITSTTPMQRQSTTGMTRRIVRGMRD